MYTFNIYRGIPKTTGCFFIAQFVFISVFLLRWPHRTLKVTAVCRRSFWRQPLTWWMQVPVKHGMKGGCEDGEEKAVLRKWTTSLSNKLLGLKNLILYFAEMLKMYEVVPHHTKHQKNVFVRYTTFGHVRPGFKTLRLFCKAPKLVATLCTPLVPWLSKRMRHSPRVKGGGSRISGMTRHWYVET